VYLTIKVMQSVHNTKKKRVMIIKLVFINYKLNMTGIHEEVFTQKKEEIIFSSEVCDGESHST